MPPGLKFAEGEKLLCFHGPLIYKAICLSRSLTRAKYVRYLIHYAGWNKKWDEWVPESRLLKYNEANLEIQKEVEKAHAAQLLKTKKSPAKRRQSKRGASSIPASEKSTAPTQAAPAKRRQSKRGASSIPASEKSTAPTQAAPAKRRQSKRGASSIPASEKSTAPTQADSASCSNTAKLRKRQSKDIPVDSGSEQPSEKRGRPNSSIESENQSLAMVEIGIRMPEELKCWLVDDWDVVMKQQKLAILPAKLTVSQIIDNYVAFKKSSKLRTQTKKSALVNITEGITEYFNILLGSRLLYKFERLQYNEILQNYPDTPLSQIYGSIHLLRLFTIIGPLMANATSDKKSLQQILKHMQDFLKYILTNKSTLLNLQDYEKATPEYIGKVV